MVKTPAQWRKSWLYMRENLTGFLQSGGKDKEVEQFWRVGVAQAIQGYARARGWWWLYS